MCMLLGFNIKPLIRRNQQIYLPLKFLFINHTALQDGWQVMDHGTPQRYFT